MYLYSRVGIGLMITLFISAVASLLAYLEMSIQGREHWVVIWFLLMCLIMLARFNLMQQFRRVSKNRHFSHQHWKNLFFLGVVASGLMQGIGAVLLMPYVTTNLQIILHSLLLGMGAGAIAYLSTSLTIYVTYLVAIMFPVTLWLFTRHSPDSYVLSFLYLFMMVAYSTSVKRMNKLVNDALYFRFDNEILVDDLQRLLESVSKSNKALEKISTTDELTGASNYRAFRVRLEEDVRRYAETKSPMSLVKLNIDYYHEYNNYYGYELGDKNLREVAKIIMSEMPHTSALVARLHGTEFALILPDTDCEKARLLVLRVIQKLAHKNIQHVKSKAASSLTLSAGLSCQTINKTTTSRDLLSSVNSALKLAKQKGRNRLEIISTS